MLLSTALICALAAFGSLSSATRSSKLTRATLRRDAGVYQVGAVSVTNRVAPPAEQAPTGGLSIAYDEAITMTVWGIGIGEDGALCSLSGKHVYKTVDSRPIPTAKLGSFGGIPCEVDGLSVEMLRTSARMAPLGWYLVISYTDYSGIQLAPNYWIPSSNSTNGPVTSHTGENTLTALPQGF